MSENETENVNEQPAADPVVESSPVPDEAPGMVERVKEMVGLGDDPADLEISDDAVGAMSDVVGAMADAGIGDAPATEAARKKAIRKGMQGNSRESTARRQGLKTANLG